MDDKMSWCSSSSPSSNNQDFSASSPDPPAHFGRAITARHHLEPVNPVRRTLFQDFSTVSHSMSSWQALPNQPFSHQSNYQAPQTGYAQPTGYVQGAYEYRSNYGFRPGRECKFCKNNGETSTLYRSHVLRDPQSGRLICPVLRSHVCEICGGTQDNAHTRNYCPKLKEDKKLKLALPVTLKKTKRQSDGQMRQ